MFGRPDRHSERANPESVPGISMHVLSYSVTARIAHTLTEDSLDLC